MHCSGFVATKFPLQRHQVKAGSRFNGSHSCADGLSWGMDHVEHASCLPRRFVYLGLKQGQGPRGRAGTAVLRRSHALLLAPIRRKLRRTADHSVEPLAEAGRMHLLQMSLVILETPCTTHGCNAFLFDGNLKPHRGPTYFPWKGAQVSPRGGSLKDKKS